MESIARATGAEALSVIGQRLRELRQENRLSQRAAADAVGLPQSNLSRIENGKQRLNLSVLARVLSLFDVTMEEFFSREKQDAAAGASSRREADLLGHWRQLGELDQRAVEEFVRFRAQRARTRRESVAP